MNIAELEIDPVWERKMGEYFGYPECCIDFFMTRITGEEELTDNQEQVHKNRGFIPCPSCADRIVGGEVQIEDLIKNRICETSYPQEDHDRERLEWVKQWFPEKAQELIDAIDNGEIFTIKTWLESEMKELELEDEEPEFIMGHIQEVLEEEGYISDGLVFKRENKRVRLSVKNNLVTIKKL